MVLPLLPIAAAGVGGGIAGGLIASVFGGTSKKEQAVQAVETHAPYEIFQPTTVDARSISEVYSPTSIIQIESPYAQARSATEITSKAASRAEADPKFWQPSTGPSPTAGITEGVDLSKIALIGAVGLIGYGVVKEVL